MRIFVLFFILCALFIPFSCLGQIEDNKSEESEQQKEQIVNLPEPEKKGEMPLEACIEKRRSTRQFKARKLSMEEISQLLWSAQGITDTSRGYRAAPSAGALYPLEIYAVTPEGVYHYLPEKHAMQHHKPEDLRRQLSDAALSQSSVKSAPLDIVVTAVYQRVTRKYGERGIRYTHMEAGHATQNVLLQSVALSLASVPVGAFRDESVKNVLSLPDDHEPLYIIPVGEPLNSK